MSSVVSSSSRGRHSAPDPGGFNPSGRKLITGEEPVGQEPVSVSPRLPNRQSLNQPPTPVNRGQQQTQQQNDGSNAPVMAFLMQAPPPPPGGSPRKSPKKRSTSRSRQTTEYPKISPMSTAKTESTYGSGGPSPASKSTQALSLVEQRLRAARAIYESDTLALPNEAPEFSTGRASQAGTPVLHKAAAPSPTESLATQQHRNTTLDAYVDSNMADANSRALRKSEQPIHRPSYPKTPTGKSTAESVGSQSTSQSRTPARAPEKRRSKTPDPKRKKTPDKRRHKTPEKRRSASETGADEQEEKKGFFRRMFRRNKNNKDAKTLDGSEMDETKVSGGTQTTALQSAAVTVAASIASAPVNGGNASRKDINAQSNELWPSQSMPEGTADRTGHRRSTSRGRRALGHNPSTSMDESLDDRPEVFFASDDVSTLTGPTIHDYDSKHYASARSSRDPTESMSQAKSAMSAEPLGFYYQAYGPRESLSNDLKEYEEQNPRDVANGGKGIDPFTEPFFKKQNKPASATKLQVITEPFLSGEERHTDDPMGESPLSSRHRREKHQHSGRAKKQPDDAEDHRRQSLQDPSPRGYTVDQAKDHQDPFGASPVHKHDRGPSGLVDGNLYAPDPPLYAPDGESVASPDAGALDSVLAEYGGDDQSRLDLREEEEKKEDDETTGPPAKSFQTLPPPPPPPPPPPGSKKASKKSRGSKSPKKSSSSKSVKKNSSDGIPPRAPPSPPPPPPPTKEAPLSPFQPDDLSVQSPPPPPPADEEESITPSPQQSEEVADDAGEYLVQEGYAQCDTSPLKDADQSPSSSYLKRTSKAIQEARARRRDGNTRSPKHAADSSPQKVANEDSENSAPHPVGDVAMDYNEEEKESPNRWKKQKESTKEYLARKSMAPRLQKESQEEFSIAEGQTAKQKAMEIEQHLKASGIQKESQKFSDLKKARGKAAEKARSNKAKDLEATKGKYKDDHRATEAQKAKAKAMEIEMSIKEKREAEEAELARIAREAMKAKKESEQSQKSRVQVSKKTIMFDSDTGEPIDVPEESVAKKSSISSLARMNAKAVAYLHTLNGEPSPRNQWQAPTTEEMADSDHGNDDAFFRAYSTKFKGRKLTTRLTVSPRSGDASTPRSRAVHVEQTSSTDWKGKRVERDVEIHESSVVRGMAIRRAHRDSQIAAGLAFRVIPKAPIKKSSQPSSVMPEPKDPIQRAGRRLLAKASIPIQAEIRRFLAQREAVDRMWALIEIQSYMRRWRAEAHLIASIAAIVVLQRVFRGFGTRLNCQKEQDAAVKVQKMVRGYLASVWAYDTVYSVILIQAQARRFFVRRRQVLEHVASVEIQKVIRGHQSRVIFARCVGALEIQRIYRGHTSRHAFLEQKRSASRIQTFWRMASAQQAYQFVIVDVIISQSVVRAFLARRELSQRNNARNISAATTMQTVFRSFTAQKKYNQNRAAIKIQKNWRCLKAYTDYIFALVDVVMAQRVCRSWLAKRRVKAFKDANAAIKIQTQWRRFQSQITLLYDLVHIIMVQSVVRRYLAQKNTWKRRIDYDDKAASAVRIQAAWRGFWRFSHFVILQYEVCKIQAAARTMQARKTYRLQLGSCILIQTAVRRHQAQTNFVSRRRAHYLVHARASRMREELACEKIQFWWQVVSECRKEKKAALTIERFFTTVKNEVECLVSQVRETEEAAKSEKKHKWDNNQRRKSREADEQMLERVWLNTVDENHVDVFAVPSSTRSNSTSVVSMVSPTYSVRPKRSTRHQSSAPSKRLVMRHDTLATEDESQTFSFSSSDLSSRVSELKKKASVSGGGGGDLGENLELEEAFLDASVEQQKKRRAADKYLKMYGVNTTPSRYRQKESLLSMTTSESSEFMSPANRPLSTKAKAVAAKYLQQKTDDDMTPSYSRKPRPRLSLESLLGDDEIGMI